MDDGKTRVLLGKEKNGGILGGSSENREQTFRKVSMGNDKRQGMETRWAGGGGGGGRGCRGKGGGGGGRVG